MSFNFEIKNRWSRDVKFTAKIDNDTGEYQSNLGLAVKLAVDAKADLSFADLSFADLRSANLRSANLRSANLSSTDLSFADLRSANLRFAMLEKGETKINWESHDLCAEILRLAAEDDIEKRKIAGLVLISREFCWSGDKSFLSIDDPLKEWVLNELRGWVVEGDKAPCVLKK